MSKINRLIYNMRKSDALVCPPGFISVNGRCVRQDYTITDSQTGSVQVDPLIKAIGAYHQRVKRDFAITTKRRVADPGRVTSLINPNYLTTDPKNISTAGLVLATAQGAQEAYGMMKGEAAANVFEYRAVATEEPIESLFDDVLENEARNEAFLQEFNTEAAAQDYIGYVEDGALQFGEEGGTEYAEEAVAEEVASGVGRYVTKRRALSCWAKRVRQPPL